MRLLFTIDKQDYAGCTRTFVRNSARSIILRGGEDPNEIFIQDNFYYLCDVEEEILPPQMEDYEEEAGFTPEFVDIRHAIRTNRKSALNNRYQTMLYREARVLELLLEEGIAD